MTKVDKEKCIRCGTCESMCPEGFEVKEDGSEVKDPNAACIENAAKACPTGAIIVEENKDGNETTEDESLSNGEEKQL